MWLTAHTNKTYYSLHKTICQKYAVVILSSFLHAKIKLQIPFAMMITTFNLKREEPFNNVPLHSSPVVVSADVTKCKKT